MTSSVEKMKVAIKAVETAKLIEISIMLAWSNDGDEIIAAEFVEAELESRMSEAAFVAHMNAVESIMDARAA